MPTKKHKIKPDQLAEHEDKALIDKAPKRHRLEPHEDPRGRTIALQCLQAGRWKKIGLVADTHLCCAEERIEELHAAYDTFSKEGVRTVFHAGNLVDGYVAKINQASVKSCTIDGQTDYAIKHYPQRKGIKTRFITGDDHEGWWIKQGFNWGAYLQSQARDAGRSDLEYIGHVEADVRLQAKDGFAVMKIQHPGGGTSYARSYTQQKMVEAFEGGEKPGILVQGHYHVSNYMQDRNVHCLQLPGFQEQTVFARKKRLRFEVGFVILEFLQQPDGTIHRFRPEFFRFFNRGFYKTYLPSDKSVHEQPVVL